MWVNENAKVQLFFYLLSFFGDILIMNLSQRARRLGRTKRMSSTVARAPIEMERTMDETVGSATRNDMAPGTRMSMRPEVSMVWMEPW